MSTRDRIVAESLRLFAERGYRGTSVADLEDAAGLSPGSGSLYTHFGTKEEVLAAAVEQTALLADTGYAAFDLLQLADLADQLTPIARVPLLVTVASRRVLRLFVMKRYQVLRTAPREPAR